MDHKERGRRAIAAMKARGTWLGLRKRKSKPVKPVIDTLIKESGIKRVSVRCKRSLHFTWRRPEMYADRRAKTPLEELIEREENDV